MNLRFLSLLLLLIIGITGNAQEDVATLKKEVAKLRSENAKLKKQLEDAEYNGYWFSSKAVRSVVPALRKLPKHLKPKRGVAWEKEDIAEVYTHIRQQLTGEPFEAKMRLKSINVSEIRKSPNSTVELSLKPFEVSFERMNFTQQITPGSMGGYTKAIPFKFDVSETAAKKFSRLKINELVLVKGQIAKIGHPYGKTDQVIIQLRNIQINDFLE